MKKIICVTLTFIMLFMFGGCGNYQYFDFEYRYDYAIIQLPNGEIVEGEVETWPYYEGEQLQVTIDGVIYLTNSYNCVLIKHL